METYATDTNRLRFRLQCTVGKTRLRIPVQVDPRVLTIKRTTLINQTQRDKRLDPFCVLVNQELSGENQLMTTWG
jgi:hypothetical protein